MIVDDEVKRMEEKQMEYMQFKERLIEALQEYFLGRGEVYYDKVKKMNDTDKDAVIVRLIGTAVQATIYLEDMYEGYKDAGDFEKCMKEVIRACEEVPFVDERYIPETWESAKGRLHMRVINKNWNKQALKRMPYREYLDLAIVFYVFIKEEGGLMATLPVSRECMGDRAEALDGSAGCRDPGGERRDGIYHHCFRDRLGVGAAPIYCTLFGLHHRRILYAQGQGCAGYLR